MSKAVEVAVIERIERYQQAEGVEPSVVDIIRWTLEAASPPPGGASFTDAGLAALPAEAAKSALKNWAREMDRGDA